MICCLVSGRVHAFLGARGACMLGAGLYLIYVEFYVNFAIHKSIQFDLYNVYNP